jgi:hypothetical protein
MTTTILLASGQEGSEVSLKEHNATHRCLYENYDQANQSQIKYIMMDMPKETHKCQTFEAGGKYETHR